MKKCIIKNCIHCKKKNKRYICVKYSFENLNKDTICFEDENELDNWNSWSDIVGSYRECDIFMGIMEKTCIKCKWYTEEKRFCKWVSGYTKNDFSCKFWRSKDVDSKNSSADSNN